MKLTKSLLSFLLVVAMISSMILPVSAAVTPATPTLTVTPNITNVDQGTGTANVVYTITLDPKGNELVVFEFHLNAPDGMTLATTASAEGGEGYWYKIALKYEAMEHPDGIFGGDFSYSPNLTQGSFMAGGGVPGNSSRVLKEATKIMTIMATIDISQAKTYKLGVSDFICGTSGEAADEATGIVNVTDVVVGTAATTYAVTVNNGTGGGNYAANATVSIQANTAGTCKAFDKWVVESGSGVTFANANSANTTFTMPANAVTIKATYKDAHSYNDTWSKDGTNHWHECTNASCPDKTGSKKDVAPHSYTVGNATPETLKSPATCQSRAVYYKSCTCGAVSTSEADTFTSGEKDLNNHTGSLGDWVRTDPDKHWKVYSCCPTVKISEAAHTPSAAPATETTSKICTTCGRVLQPALGHICANHLTKVDAKESSCFEQGNDEYYTCTCGKWYTNNTATTEITDHDSVKRALKPHDFTSSTEWGYRGADGHALQCKTTGCTAHQTPIAPHTPGAPATDTTAQTCTDCGYEITPATGHTHSYTVESTTATGALKTPATCQSRAVYYKSCTCGAVSTSEADTFSAGNLGDHNWETGTNWGFNDATGHAHKCLTHGCTAHQDIVPHNWDGPQDTFCNSCGYERTITHTHSYDEDTWAKDDTNHWHECTNASCPAADKGKKDSASHVFDDDTDTTCDTCGYVRTITPTPSHTHNYDEDTWSKDNNNHWHECTNASCPDKTGSKKDVAPHSYTDDADTECNDCGYVRTIGGSPDPDDPDDPITPVTPSTPGESGGSGKSSAQKKEENFWRQVEDDIKSAKPGEKLDIDTKSYSNVPWYVMEAIRQSGVTVTFQWKGESDIVVPSEKAPDVAGQIFYPLADLADLLAKQPAAPVLNPETGGAPLDAPLVQPKPAAPAQTPAAQAPAKQPKKAETVQPSAPAQAPVVQEPQPEQTQRSGSGVLFAGIAAAAALVAAVIWFVLGRKKGRNDL